MKCRINYSNLNVNLTLDQVLSMYVVGRTPAEWVEICRKTLSVINPNNGEWLWPNARLVFTRHGNLYTVKNI